MLLNARGIRKEFAGEVILEEFDLRMERHEKVALVGRNGAGKTTLLKILTGELEPDSGGVHWERGVSTGYLSQHATLNPSLTVIEEAERARAHLVELQDRLEMLETKLNGGDAQPEDLDEYSLIQEHFIAQGGYAIERDFKVVLQRMGFEEAEFSKPVSKLSGGERTRLMLAKMLLQEPEMLILDEPTNHLDLQAVEWLERWIKSYHGAVLIVSHDRTFLNSVAQRTVELRNGRSKSYPGPYEKFVELRKAEDEWQAEVARRQQDEMAKLDEFVRRFMNSQRTAQARGRQKQLQKLQERVVEAPKNDKGIAAGFGSVKRSGDLVVECKDLGMAFEDTPLFQHLDWTVRIGERWGVIGENGVGKSTLLKIILGKLTPTSGAFRVGSNVLPAYFAQDAETLDSDLSPMHILNETLGMELGPARSLLGRFLLSGDDATRPVKTLSGGERNKVQLAVLTGLHPNLLILDEPTNHLDMASREALADVLRDYTGTLILVSHDRWLLERTTDHTLDIRRSGVIAFGGHYGEYRSWQDRKTSARPAPKPATPPPAVEGVFFRKPGSGDVPPTPLSPREISKQIERLGKEVSKTEDEVAKLELELEELERVMARPPTGADLMELSLNHGRLRQAIEDGLSRWESLSTELEQFKQLQGA